MFIREYNHFTSERPNHIAGGVHPYHEILYISSGDFVLHWIGHTYKAQGPALFVFSPSTPHSIDQTSENLQSWFIEVRLQETDFCPSLEALHIWNMRQNEFLQDRRGFGSIATTLATIDRAILGNLPKPVEDTFFLSLVCDIQKLLLLINHYVTKSHAKTDNALSPFRFDKWSSQSQIYGLIRHIENNYRQEITLEELSRRSGYTPSYIIRLFKEMTDQTPLHYLYDLRLNAATTYLLTTAMSIQEIAECTGFSNIHYFSRMFKKKFGQSPTAWKHANL